MEKIEGLKMTEVELKKTRKIAKEKDYCVCIINNDRCCSEDHYAKIIYITKDTLYREAKSYVSNVLKEACENG